MQSEVYEQKKREEFTTLDEGNHWNNAGACDRKCWWAKIKSSDGKNTEMTQFPRHAKRESLENRITFPPEDHGELTETFA